MIKFTLQCHDGHEFEGWFRNSAAYEAQVASARIACPHCGSHSIDKAIMAPAVARRDASETPPPRAVPQGEDPVNAPLHALHRRLRELRDEIHSKAEYVGGRFAEEARRIHFEESPPRGIYGEASSEEARELAEDGIPFLPVPRLPEDLN
mgnify:CR=1 FL=1